MWWERNACGPRARQNVLLSSAPHPSTGRPTGVVSARGSGANPRERRIGSTRPRSTRTTESSARVWMARSWSRTASAIGASGAASR